MSAEIKDLIYIVVLAVGIASSHFMLRSKVLVLEERLRGHTDEVKRIFDALSRIEEKLDKKADK